MGLTFAVNTYHCSRVKGSRGIRVGLEKVCFQQRAGDGARPAFVPSSPLRSIFVYGLYSTNSNRHMRRLHVDWNRNSKHRHTGSASRKESAFCNATFPAKPSRQKLSAWDEAGPRSGNPRLHRSSLRKPVTITLHIKWVKTEHKDGVERLGLI